MSMSVIRCEAMWKMFLCTNLSRHGTEHADAWASHCTAHKRRCGGASAMPPLGLAWMWSLVKYKKSSEDASWPPASDASTSAFSATV